MASSDRGPARSWTRRHFVKTSALGLASLGCPWLHGFDRPTAPKKMRFGLVTYLWGQDLKLPRLIEVCEESQALGIELRTTHAHGVERTLDAEQRTEVKARFENSPVELVGIGSDERFDSPDAAELKKSIDATKAFVRLSRDVGGSGVKVKPDSFHEGVPRERTIEQIGKSLNEVGRHAAEHGQQIRLEVHGGCSELPTIQKILEVADHPAVAVCWNCNEADLRGQGLTHNFGLVAKRLGATVHIRHLRRHQYPYPELFALLREARYTGWVLLEARGKLPENRGAALKEQREEFERLIAG